MLAPQQCGACKTYMTVTSWQGDAGIYTAGIAGVFLRLEHQCLATRLLQQQQQLWNFLPATLKWKIIMSQWYQDCWLIVPRLRPAVDATVSFLVVHFFISRAGLKRSALTTFEQSRRKLISSCTCQTSSFLVSDICCLYHITKHTIELRDHRTFAEMTVSHTVGWNCSEIAELFTASVLI